LRSPVSIKIKPVEPASRCAIQDIFFKEALLIPLARFLLTLLIKGNQQWRRKMSIQGPGKPRDSDSSSKLEEIKSEPQAKRENISSTTDEAKKKDRGLKGFAKKMLSSVKNTKNKLLQKLPLKSQDVEESQDTKVNIIKNGKILSTDSKIDTFKKAEEFAKHIKDFHDLEELNLKGANLNDESLKAILEAVNDTAEWDSKTYDLPLNKINLSENTITDKMAAVPTE
jgi:hypothetical protein